MIDTVSPTTRILGTLGSSYALWNNVAIGRVAVGRASSPSAQTLDHIVLGPTGLFAVASGDWGAALRLRKGELTGAGLRRGERPIRALTRLARSFARSSGVRFNGLLLVVPDDAIAAPLTVLRRRYRCPTLLVRRSWLAEVLRLRMSGVPARAGDEIRAARERIDAALRAL